MKFDVQWCNVLPNLVTGIPPSFMLERELLHGTNPKGSVFNVAEVVRVGRFMVPQTPVLLDQVKWAMTDSGQYVRVPIFAYRTNGRSLSEIWGLGIQIGLAAAESLRSIDPQPPKSAILVLGHECTDLSPEEAFRCYVGVAFRTDQ